MCALLETDRAGLFVQATHPFPDVLAAPLHAMVRRRLTGDPVAYILGKQEFYGREFAITPAVLVPRPETELLVERVLALAPRSLLEIGTGSGCVVVSCAVALQEAACTATDIAADALAVAEQNAERYRVAHRCTFLSGDLYAPVRGRGPFDVIASNPPYVESTFTVETNEPNHALYAGADGLDVIRRLIVEAPLYLHADGVFLCEIGEHQAEAVRALAEEHFGMVTIHSDLRQQPRLLEATDPNY